MDRNQQIFGRVLLLFFQSVVMLADVKWDGRSGECGRACSDRSGPMVSRVSGKCRQYKSMSGNPLSYIGRSLTTPHEHFVLLFNQMLASGHHSDYDAPT